MKKLKNPAGILSMDAIGLTNYIRRRYDRIIPGIDDLDETRDIAFQILANKSHYESNYKLHLKLSYTLIKAKHLGFPYLDRYYSEYYNTSSNVSFNGSNDLLLLNTGKFILDNLRKCISNHLTNNIQDLLFLHKTKDTFTNDAMTVSKLCLKVILELWIKNNLPEALEFKLDKRGINVSNDGIIHLSHLIEIYCCLIALGIHNEGIIDSFLEFIDKFYRQFDIKTKILLFNALATINSLRILDTLKMLLSSITQTIKSTELNDVLILLQGLKLISYKERLLDDLLTIHLMPKVSKMRIEDLFNVIDVFISLDYRCSTFFKLLDNEGLLKNMTPIDLSVLPLQSIKLSQLNQPINHLLTKISYELNDIIKMADYKVLENLNELYIKHHIKNDFLNDYILQIKNE